jgi:hypothetical protein
MNHIAEQFQRAGTKECIQFLAMAKTSAGECGHSYTELPTGTT